jgi:hypothetical protein
MVEELFFRTEDIKIEEILDFYVPTERDMEIVQSLKAAKPVILEGSRGTGKSFLLRVTEAELIRSFSEDRIVPIYVTFRKSALLQTNDPYQFHHWMVSRFCSEMMHTLRRLGLLIGVNPEISILPLNGTESALDEAQRMSEIAKAYEESFRKPGCAVDYEKLPSIDELLNATEDICRKLKIKRLIALFDEATHNFRPEQQRQFFTLFRDLRSPYISCKAAVYPGVTSFGDTFQRSHDASWLNINRDILDTNYVENMRQIVQKQAASELEQAISRNEANFKILAYASGGNPRLLLKNVAQTLKMNSKEVNVTVREFYRHGIWSEHSNMAELYTGYQQLIDWGRNFIEKSVLPSLQKYNLGRGKRSRTETTCFFWVNRDAPEIVKHALRLLAYTGIVVKESDGTKNNKSEIGTRYSVNLGCLFALDATPATEALDIAQHLTTRRSTEYGANAKEFEALVEQMANVQQQPDLTNVVLQRQLAKDLDVLDITDWQRGKLREAEYKTVGDVLDSSETDLQKIHQVGEKRSRRISNAAVASVLEYLSG